jgi:hypothetical protein
VIFSCLTNLIKYTAASSITSLPVPFVDKHFWHYTTAMPTTSGAVPPWKRRLTSLWKRASRSDLRSRNATSAAGLTSESTPLLRRILPTRQNSDWNPTRREAKRYRFRLLLTMCLAFSLIAALGNVMLDIASVRLIEMSICRDYYRVHKPKLVGPPPLSYVQDYLCQVKEVQSSLLDLRVLKGLIMIIPGIWILKRYIINQ